jgi:acetyltransferase-like isoleucine patch superfamily enzyme
MKAITELGLVKIIRFFLYTVWQIIFTLMIFPQLRVFWLRLFGAHIGEGTIIYQLSLLNLYHKGLTNLSIGDYCFVGSEVSFDLSEKITIGNRVNIGERTIISTHLKVGYKNHPLQKYFPIRKTRVLIEEGAFVGVGSMILAGSTIGKYAFVTAGTIIHGNIPEWTLVRSGSRNIFQPIKTSAA